MENRKKQVGRPMAEVKKSVKVTIRFSKLDAEILNRKATDCGLEKSEFIRQCLQSSKVEVYKSSFPPDIKVMIGSLNRIAADINSLAHKNNRGEFLYEKDKDNLREWLKGIVAFKNKVETYINDCKI